MSKGKERLTVTRFEEVILTRWECPECGDITDSEVYQCCAEKAPKKIRLTGFYTREKVCIPRRVSIELAPSDVMHEAEVYQAISHHIVRFYAEWDEPYSD